MSTDGGHGRPPLAGSTEDEQRDVYYFVLWPNMLAASTPTT